MKHVGRKLYHVFGGLTLLTVYYLLGSPRAFWAYGVLFTCVLLLDLARLRLPAFNAWTLSHLSAFIRPAEAVRLTGSPAYILGVALTFLFFDPEIATAATLFLVFGDVSASIVGESWGRTQIKGKSLEGAAAFMVAGLLAGAALRGLGFMLSAQVLVAGVVIAAVIEFLSPPWLNDNLAIPLASAGIMTTLGKFIN